MYMVKVREPGDPISNLSFLKTDNQYESFKEASDRASYLIGILPHGTEIFIYEDSVWIEKHLIPSPRET